MKSPEPSPRLDVKAHALPSRSTTDTFVVSPCRSTGVPKVSTSARTRSVLSRPCRRGRRGTVSGTADRPPRVTRRPPAYPTSTGSVQRASYASKSARLSRPPRQPSVFAPKRLETRGQSGHGARSGTDGVMNELRAERDVEVDQLGRAWLVSQSWHGDEAIEIANTPARGLVVDRVTASQKSRHHRLGDT